MKTTEYTRNKSFILSVVYVLTFLAAYLCGSILAAHTSADTLIAMRALPVSRVAIVAQLAVLLLPLFLTFLVIRFFSSYYLLPIIFLEVSCFSFSTCCLLYSFPVSGWLVCCLLLFPAAASLVIYIWLWTRWLIFRTLQLKRDLIISLVAVVIFTLIEVYILSPFTAQLFIH